MWRAVFLIFSLFAAGPALAEDTIVSSVEAIGRTPSNIVVERVMLKSLAVAIEKMQGSLADASVDLPKALDALELKLKEKGVEVSGAPLVQFDEVDGNNYVAELMLPIAIPPKETIAGLQFGASFAGQALRVTHKGPLASLEDTYFEILTFIEDGGFEAKDVMIERYLTNSATTAPKDMQAEIYVPLK